MLKDKPEAQDLIQEIFLSIWTKAPAFCPNRGSAYSWAARQVRSRAIDRIRSRKRHAELVEAHGPELEPKGSATSCSADACELKERHLQIRSAMQKLSEKEKQVLRMAYFEDMTQVEIAGKLSKPLGTIKARTVRGMTRLRSRLVRLQLTG